MALAVSSSPRLVCVWACFVRVLVLYAGLVARHGLAFSSSPQLNVKHHYVTIWLKLMLELTNLTDCFQTRDGQVEEADQKYTQHCIT